jgi:hypothetical protein
MNDTRDIVFKRCGCTDEATGRQLAGPCMANRQAGAAGVPAAPVFDERTS